MFAEHKQFFIMTKAEFENNIDRSNKLGESFHISRRSHAYKFALEALKTGEPVNCVVSYDKDDVEHTKHVELVLFIAGVKWTREDHTITVDEQFIFEDEE